MSYTLRAIDNLKAKAVASYKASKKIVRSLKQMQPNALDKKIHEMHFQEFEKIDCLECARCCKSISPAMYDSDIRRMAAAMKLKVPDFVDTYLMLDEDEEYVFKSVPCPFLGSDHYCSIYTSRPKACREYPHTNRKRFYQILDLTVRNTKVCPAVFNIVENLKSTTGK